MNELDIVKNHYEMFTVVMQTPTYVVVRIPRIEMYRISTDGMMKLQALVEELTQYNTVTIWQDPVYDAMLLAVSKHAPVAQSVRADGS